jgi:hypothetical protein
LLAAETLADVSPPPTRVAHLIEQGEATLGEASGVIANGYLRSDREELIRAVRSAVRRGLPWRGGGMDSSARGDGLVSSNRS